MPSLTTLPHLTAQGQDLDLSPDAFGWLRSSGHLIDDAEALRERMRQDGYLFLPGALDRDEVMESRRVILERLAPGALDPNYPLMDAVARKEIQSYFQPDLAHDNAPLMRLLYSGRMMDFYAHFLGGPVRHFDYTWMRAVSPNMGTAPHCDIVYMGRGTTNLYTSWTPLGDVDLNLGGLIVLENSHLNERLKAGYGSKDADEYCANRMDVPDWGPGNGRNIGQGGALSRHPVQLRARLGGRWLTAEFRAGDLLVFGMYTVHASLDNHSDRFRLSSDTRYQLASEPVDERWIGEDPPAHSSAVKRGRIC